MLYRPAQWWLCTRPTDMRKQHQGLIALVSDFMGMNPLSGQGFVFINARRTLLKCLYFEPGGYCLWYKRLEQGEFARLRAPADARHLALSATELHSLLEVTDQITPSRLLGSHPTPSVDQQITASSVEESAPQSGY